MKWYVWTGLGIGALWLLLRKPGVNLPTTGLTLGYNAQTKLTDTVYNQLTQVAQSKIPTVTNISITQWGDGSLTFTGQAPAPDGKGLITIKLFEAKDANDALAQLAKI